MFSVSSRPTGTLLCGKLGSPRRSACIPVWRPLSSASIPSISRPSLPISSMMSLASSPDFFISPIFLPASFRLALSVSTCWISVRRISSRPRRSSRSKVTLRAENSARVLSGSFRSLERSCIELTRSAGVRRPFLPFFLWPFCLQVLCSWALFLPCPLCCSSC